MVTPYITQLSGQAWPVQYCSVPAPQWHCALHACAPPLYAVSIKQTTKVCTCKQTVQVVVRDGKQLVKMP